MIKQLRLMCSRIDVRHLEKIRYLLAGGVNTVFGYGVGVGLYLHFSPRLNAVQIAVIANILSITVSFLTYKLFVFRTQGNWIKEYLRSYVAYGSMALLGIFMFWAFIDIFHLNIWLVQALTVVLTATVSFFAHKHFTFKKSERKLHT